LSNFRVRLQQRLQQRALDEQIIKIFVFASNRVFGNVPYTNKHHKDFRVRLQQGLQQRVLDDQTP
jgi:hypothetical protein